MKILLFIFLTMLLSACVPTSETEFTQYEQEQSVVTSDAPPPQVVQDFVKTCDQAEQDGTILTYNTRVFFPATIECEFNEQGNTLADLNQAMNGPRIDGRVTARREQSYQVTLPSSGKVCDIDFDFPDQKMKYDDEIFLLLDNYVLMSSTNYATNSGSSKYAVNGLRVNSLGIQEYNWIGGQNALYGLYYGRQVTPQYCLGVNVLDPNLKNKCQIPPTDTPGQIKLDIPSTEIAKLHYSSSNLSDISRMDFKFVSTGDDNFGDCEHSAFGFDISVKYIP